MICPAETREWLSDDVSNLEPKREILIRIPVRILRAKMYINDDFRSSEIPQTVRELVTNL